MAAKINNVDYSWSMIQLQTSLSGESASAPIFVDATAISWKASRKVDNLYGLGGQPRKRGFGNVTYEASITLPFGTQIALRNQSGNSTGTLMGLGEFNIVVSWLNDLAKDVSTETVTLAGCIFTEDGMDASQDDTTLTHEFDLHPYRIYTPKAAQLGASGWSYEMFSK